MRNIYFLIFVLLSFLGFSQTTRNVYEEATQRDMQKLSTLFSITEDQKGTLHDLLYRKYKFYYGMSERPSSSRMKEFENQLHLDLINIFHLSEATISDKQKKALQDLVIFKTEF